ncbi:hypothetical protein BS47DRAFT_1353316, partial [Hydnum rufescens UP504]
MRKSSGQIDNNAQSRPELIPRLLPVQRLVDHWQSDCRPGDNRGSGLDSNWRISAGGRIYRM